MPTSMAWFTAPPHAFLLISSNRFARFKEPCSVEQQGEVYFIERGKFVVVTMASVDDIDAD